WKQVSWAESAHVPLLLRFPGAHGNSGRIVVTPISTPDILPSLLGLAGIPVPDKVEGENLSELIRGGDEIPDRTALYMSVSPFDGQSDGVPYRAIRSTRYTFVRNLDGPWRLFDDINDPFQLNNLIDNQDFIGITSTLDKKLQLQLDKIGDGFHFPEQYIEKWGLKVHPDRGHIPFNDFSDKAQIPKSNR